MSDTPSVYGCYTLSEEERRRLIKMKVPSNLPSRVYTITNIKTNTTTEVAGPDVITVINRLIVDRYYENPDLTEREMVELLLNEFEGMVKFICCATQMSYGELELYLQGKTYPYILQPIHAVFSKTVFESHRADKLRIEELKRLFPDVSEDEELSPTLVAVKQQVMMYLYSIKVTNMPVNYWTFFDYLNDNNNWDYPFHSPRVHIAIDMLNNLADGYSFKSYRTTVFDNVVKIKELFDIDLIFD